MSWLYEPEPGEHDLDESDVRIRPNPKGNRPRTKKRPTHDSAVPAMVLQVNLARYQVRLENGDEVLATLAKELRKEGCVVGDQVGLLGDVSGDTGSLCRIVRIESRSTLLRRSAQDDDATERPIVANATQLAIVISAKDPEPRTGLVDRYLVAAFHARLKPLLLVTKTDLDEAADFISNYKDFNLTVIKTRSDSFDLTELEAALENEVTVFVGHSGVGKSTLVNALSPDAHRSIGIVNDLTGKGRHTSSSARAIALDAGWIIDTPGIRTFGLAHISPSEVLVGFADLAEASNQCPRDCSHLIASPDCALDELVLTDQLSQTRLDSMRRLIASLDIPEWER